MGILVSFLRGIVSLVLFAAAVTTVVIDMEFIGEKLGKYKLLRYGLIAGVVLLLFLIGFNSTCNVVIIAIDIYGVWAFFRRKKEDDLAWEERQANEEKERRATECYQKAENIKKTDLVQARELYREAAELGHRKAQYQYGWYCLRGIGGEKDPQQAFENLTKADEMRRNEKYDLELERDVHYALGLCYSQGAGTERNDSEAVTRLEWAAEHGSSGATVVAGNVYKRNGQKSDAERMYRTAAGQGSVMSIYEVAQICMGKEGNLDAYREALELFEAVKLADARREEACEEAIQTLKGYIAEEQQKEAKAYFEDGGKDAISLEQARELYQDAIEEMKQTLEYKTVTDKLEKAAFGSYAPAEFLCGYFWIKGMTKTQNPFIAAEWIRRAVNQDYIEDNLVEYDWILAQDEALAARILELGKQRGSAFALYRQGADAMQKGNTEEAIAAYQKAADVGNAEACYRLAIWTAQQANGNLSGEEFKQVLSWLKQAAQQEHPEACYCIGALMEKNHPEVACKYYEIAANRQYIPAMLKLALLYDKEDTLFEQLFWMDRLVWNGEHSPLKDLPRIHMLYAEKLKKEAISDLQSEQQPETYKSRIEACREAILETGKAIFWQKCISRQPEKNDKEVNQMYEVQKKLYVYLDSLEDLKHYAEKKKRIDAEIEKAEEEHAREAALYAQQKKEDALRNAEMMGVIFGAEMEAYLLARDFAEEIKEDPWLYCALTDVDPWLVNIL